MNPFPNTRQGLEAAGYKFAGIGGCQSCRAQIVWFTTPQKKRMPFEIAIRVEGSDPILQPHFASCPQAKEFRRKKPGKGKGKRT